MASPPELLRILRISPIAMGEDGLHPATFEKVDETFTFQRGQIGFSLKNLERDTPAAGVKKLEQNFYVLSRAT